MAKKILLAEDSVTMQKVFEMTFAAEDVTITAVASAVEAVARAKEMSPDLVIADLSMPGRNGYDVCEDLKSDAKLAGTPVLLLHGTASNYDEGRARKIRSDGDIIKPFETQTVIDKVKALLAAPRPEQARERAEAREHLGPVQSLASPIESADIRTGAAKLEAVPAAGALDAAAPVVTATKPAPAPQAKPSTAPLPPAPPRPPARPAAPPPPVAPAAAATSVPASPVVTAGSAAASLPPTVPAAVTPAPATQSPKAVPAPAVPAPVTLAPATRPAATPGPAEATPPRARPAAAPAAPAGPAAPVLTGGGTKPGLGESAEVEITIEAEPPADGELATPLPAFDVVQPEQPGSTPLLARSTLPGIGLPPPPAGLPLPPPPAGLPPPPVGLPLPAMIPPGSPAATRAASSQAHSAERLDPIAYDAIARLSREIIEKIVWEVVPDLAERIIREEIDRLVDSRRAK